MTNTLPTYPELLRLFGIQTYDQNGNVLPNLPTIEAVAGDFLQLKQQVGLMQASMQQLLTVQLPAMTDLINTKGSQTTLSSISQRVSALDTTLQTKADAATVTQQIQTITTLNTEQTNGITALQAALAADGGTLQSLLSTQTTLTNQLATLRTDVDSKAPSTTVTNLSGQFTTLRNAVNSTDSGLAATKLIADAAKLKADNALPLDGGTMKSGSVVTNLTVTKAAAMDKAVRKDELVGGLQQPYRFFLDVQSTPVGAFQRNGERIDIADDNGTGQVLVLTSVTITNTGTGALASTINLTAKNAAGTTIFTQSIPVILTNMPVVGKTLDLLSLLTTPPVDISLTEPIFFFVSASAGKFTIRIEGKKR